MSTPTLVQRLRLRANRSDLVRLAASLILAVLLWGWVTNAQDPEMTRSFASVPIEIGEVPAPLEVVGTIPDVSVTVTGPRSVVSELNSGDLTASLDLDDVDEAGEFTVDIEVESPRSVWRTTSSPSRLPIRVEESVTRQFVIEAQVTGMVDATRQVSASIVDASEATVVGPRTSVERVARVVAPVLVEDQSRDFTATVSPQAVDEMGQPIPEVDISPDTVGVHVTIDARGKRVAVLTQLEGTPAQGYEVVDRTINPDTVLVDGPDEVVDQLISVTTEPIDVSGASETVTRRVQITGLPEGVQVMDPADGRVDVVIQIRQLGVSQALPAQSVQVVGLGQNLEVDLSPEAVAVTVVAPEGTLGGLTTSELTIQVNVMGLGPGTYQLTPVVALPPNVTWIASDPATITVTISPAGGIAPSPQAAATPLP